MLIFFGTTVSEFQAEGLENHNDVFYMTGSVTDELLTIDIDTGIASFVNTSSSADDFGAGISIPEDLASHNGTLYLVARDDKKIYSVNVDNGIATEVTPAFTEVGKLNAIASHNGALYLIGGAVLYEVDLDADTLTRVHASNSLGITRGEGMVSSGPDGPNIVLDNLSSNTQYWIRVIAVQSGLSDGTPSSSVTITTVVDAPAQVTGVQLTPSSTSMEVNWNGVPGATGYKVQWSESSGTFDTTNQLETVNNSATISSLTENTTYYVVVTATKSGASDGVASSEVSATTTLSTPGQVTGLSVESTSYDNIDIVWNSVSIADGYKIQWRTDTGTYGVDNQATVAVPVMYMASATKMYTVDVGTGEAEQIGTNAHSISGGALAYYIDTLYLMQLGQLYSVNTHNGALTQLTTNSGFGVSEFSVMAFTEHDSKLYFAGLNNDTLYLLDAETFTATAIGSGLGITGINGLASLNNTLYAIDANTDKLYTVSTSTGTATVVDNSTVQFGVSESGPTGLTAHDGTLYMVGVTNDKLYSLNTSTGAATAVASSVNQFGASENVPVGLTSTGPDGPEDRISGLTENTLYYIRVIATRSGASDSTPSSSVNTTTLLTPPPQVTNLTLTTTKATEINVAWDVANRATGYRVQWRTSSGAYNSTNRIITSNTVATISNLSTNTLYYVRVTAIRTNAADGLPSEEQSLSTLLSPPDTVTNVTVVAISHSTINLTWNASNDADSYIMQYKGVLESYSDTRQVIAARNAGTIINLLENTEYFIRVIATRIGGENAAPSTEISSTTLYAPPVQVTGVSLTTSSSTEIEVSWQPVASAEGYKIQWRIAGETYGTTNQVTTEDTSITIENLTPRTQYYIQVIATRDNAQDGTPSIESNIHTLAPPPDVTDNVSLSGFNANTIHVSWNSVTDANYYKVQWKTGTQEYDVSRQLLIQHPTTTASIGSLNANTLYYVQVITHITGAEDSAGVEESITTPASGAPDRVTGVTITNVTWTSLTVSWSPISSADGYILQWSTTSGTYDNTNSSRLTGANNTSAGIQSLTENTTYYIQVTAFSGGINGTASAEVSATTEYQTPGAVTGVSASPTSNGTEISVSWTAAARATGYEIRWSTTSGSYGATWQGSCSSCTSYTITSPTLGNTYYIQVRATRTSADEGEPSTEISILFANAAQVTNVTVVANSDTELEVTWNASDRADGYKLQWRLSSGTYGSTNQITTTTATEATITSLVASTTYYIRVIATRTDYPDAVPSVETSRTTLGPPLVK